MFNEVIDSVLYLICVFPSKTQAKDSLNCHYTIDYRINKNSLLFNHYVLSYQPLSKAIPMLQDLTLFCESASKHRITHLLNSQGHKSVVGICIDNLQESRIWQTSLECCTSLNIGSKTTLAKWILNDSIYNFNPLISKTKLVPELNGVSVVGGTINPDKAILGEVSNNARLI